MQGSLLKHRHLFRCQEVLLFHRTRRSLSRSEKPIVEILLILIWRTRKVYKIPVSDLKEKNNLEDLDVDGRILVNVRYIYL
jgi:hypothetical protein